MSKTNLPFRLDKPMALDDRSLRHLETQAEQHAAGVLSNDRARGGKSQRGIGIISIHGVMLYFDSWMGTNMTRVGHAIDAALAHNEIDEIILDIDSPGGTVMGTPELFDKVFAANRIKPITAMVNPMAASAAYYVASAAREIYVTKSGEVGSIGVWTSHVDQSGMMERIGVDVTLIHAGKYKVEGNPYEPLPDDARAEMQREVNESYREFVAAVARGRGVPVAKVQTEFGQGRMLSAKRAFSLGMVDGITTMDHLLAKKAKRGDSVRQVRNEDPDTTKFLQSAWDGEFPVEPVQVSHDRIGDEADYREFQAEKRNRQPRDWDKLEAQRADDEAKYREAMAEFNRETERAGR